MFRKSPLKNEILQIYINVGHGHELMLIICSKTRWNSFLAMLERFVNSRSAISKALVDKKEICSVRRNSTFLRNWSCSEACKNWDRKNKQSWGYISYSREGIFTNIWWVGPAKLVFCLIKKKKKTRELTHKENYKRRRILFLG